MPKPRWSQAYVNLILFSCNHRPDTLEDVEMLGN